MTKKITLSLSKSSAILAASILATGCTGSAGVAGLNVSGRIATGGKIIDAGLNLGTNTVTVSGLFAQGTNTYSGTVTAPVK